MVTQAFAESIQSLTPGNRVHLYELDTTPIGFTDKLYFTPSGPDEVGNDLVYNGITYSGAAIVAEGFAVTGKEKPPQPTITIGNAGGLGNALLNQYSDLVGAKITIITTYRKFLDDQPTADPLAHYLPEIYYVEQKEEQNKEFVKWRLDSALSLHGKKIPRRLVLKNTCQHTYRRYDSSAGSFDYTNVSCPYGQINAGNNYFKLDGTQTTLPQEDNCSKNLTACRLRFGSETLPAWFFPGVRRF